MPFAATTMCVLIIGSMVSANVTVVKAAGIQILTAVTVSPLTLSEMSIDGPLAVLIYWMKNDVEFSSNLHSLCWGF
jgi:hypothetical protein